MVTGGNARHNVCKKKGDREPLSAPVALGSCGLARPSQRIPGRDRQHKLEPTVELSTTRNFLSAWWSSQTTSLATKENTATSFPQKSEGKETLTNRLLIPSQQSHGCERDTKLQSVLAVLCSSAKSVRDTRKKAGRSKDKTRNKDDSSCSRPFHVAVGTSSAGSRGEWWLMRGPAVEPPGRRVGSTPFVETKRRIMESNY